MASTGRVPATRIILAIMLVVDCTLTAVLTRPAAAAGTPLREVDWAAVLLNDPTITAELKNRGGLDVIHVQVPMPDGYPLEGDVLSHGGINYGDLDGDGADEAVIHVFGGPSAKSFGFMLYHEDSPAPRRILVRTGLDVGADIQDGHLLITDARFNGFEHPCCPSADMVTSAALDGDQLVPLSTEIRPRNVQPDTVEAFYQALSERKYEDAYQFLSPSFQANNPFESWKATYANTEKLLARTGSGATPTEVAVALISTERQADGSLITHEYRGTWSVIWNPEKTRWLLDEATIEQVT